MLRLEKVTRKNIWEVITLSVDETQKQFVATNTESLLEAYLTLDLGASVYLFCIYDDNVLVGFVMIGYDTDQEWEDCPSIAKGNYSIWRYMIDHRYQGNGYGKKGLKLALDFIQTSPCGKAEYCWLSYEPENTVAHALYQSLGFEENGEKDGNEIVMVKKL